MEATALHAAQSGRSTPPVAVRPCTDADARGWDAFVERCAEATFFHRIGWRAIIEEEFRHRTHYLIAERGDAIVGVLPLAEVRSRLFGHALVSLPFAVYGGPATEDDGAATALIGAASDRARELGVTHLEVRNVKVRERDWPRQDLYVRFRKTLDPDVEANMLAIPRKQRAMVRKGIKNGLTSVVDESPDRFFELYADNVHRHGTPGFSRRYFRRLQQVFGDRCETLVVLDPGGVPVSGVMSFYFRGEVLPYYAGDTLAARQLAANDFKYWELMRRACERGVRVFDYGRSKRGTGSFDFKKNWGFDAEPLAYEYLLLRRASIPQNNPSNPKYRAFIALWRRMPRALVDRIGPHLVRSLA
jgi:FemAB-related protein (PEP-CTERM system-associated)